MALRKTTILGSRNCMLFLCRFYVAARRNNLSCLRGRRVTLPPSKKPLNFNSDKILELSLELSFIRWDIPSKGTSPLDGISMKSSSLSVGQFCFSLRRPFSSALQHLMAAIT